MNSETIVRCDKEVGQRAERNSRKIRDRLATKFLDKDDFVDWPGSSVVNSKNLVFARTISFFFELFSRFEFDFRRRGFFLSDSNSWVVRGSVTHNVAVHVIVLWPLCTHTIPIRLHIYMYIYTFLKICVNVFENVNVCENVVVFENQCVFKNVFEYVFEKCFVYVYIPWSWKWFE